MNKKDKKFIAALVFMQTGILLTFISASGYFWHRSMVSVMKLNNLKELSQYVNGEVNQAQSNTKVKKLKQHYQTKGVRAEEH